MIQKILAFLFTTMLITGLSGALLAQDQHFVDETEDRLLERYEWDSDGMLGDIDGDGDLDILVATPQIEWDHSYVVLNDGDGYFPEDNYRVLYPYRYGFRGLAMGDVDRDNDLDVYLASVEDSGRPWTLESTLLLNDGGGSFTDVGNQRLPNRPYDQQMDAVFVDVDADGFLDIMAASIDRYDDLWINNGTAYFNVVYQNQFPTGSYWSESSAWGDLDGDFDADCMLSLYDAVISNILMVNDGSGWFRDESARNLPSQRYDYYSYASCLVDIDGDRDLDVVIAKSSWDYVWINDGTGHFTDETDSRLIGDYGWDSSYDVVAGDVDNDGDFDLLLANWGGKDRLFINDGDGYFTNETSERFPSRDEVTRTLALGDIDRDGDLDCFVVTPGEYQQPTTGRNRLFINESTPDSVPPVIPRTYHHPDTKDTLNPYLVTTTVWDNISVAVDEIEVTLHYQVHYDGSFRLSNEGYYKARMLNCGGYLYRAWIPAQPNGSTVSYYVLAKDRMGNTAFDPPDAPESTFNFRVDARERTYDNEN